MVALHGGTERMYDGGAGLAPATGHVVGNIRELAQVASPELGNVRDVQVYLPRSYRSGGRHYPVVYMQDGQNLFDERRSFAGEWQVDETMEALGGEGIEAIVVAIPNMGSERADEYSPFHQPGVGGGRGDAYVRFIVDTLKPLVDRRFRTRPERGQTGLMGSSLGGLISLYGFLVYPEVFGFAGAMSPALWFARRAIFDVAEAVSRWDGRVYVDVGTAEGRTQVRNARQMVRLLRRKARYPRRSLMYAEDRGAGHNEQAWAARFGPAIRFLLPKPPSDLHW